jgi:hypothetical protein
MVFRLNIFNCVEENDFERFEVTKDGTSKKTLVSPIVSAEPGGPVPINGETGPDATRVYLVSPLRMLFEVATQSLITAPDLFDCVVTAPVDPVETTIKVELQQKHDFRNLYRVEILRQVWRWQGRPAAPHPELETPGTNDPKTVAEWAAVEFGEIRETDYIVYPATPYGKLDKKGFSYSEQLGGPKYSGDRRGLAFRFAFRGYSRYEGWLSPSRASVLAASTAPGAAPDASANPGTVWKDLFVAPRPQMPLPAPKVRLIFPLTERFDKNPKGVTPGLLVVLDEPWYERGGLGEKLEAELHLSSDPRLSPDQNKTFFYEMGPDPLFQGGASSALSPQKEEDPAANAVADANVRYKVSAGFKHPIVGPAGHTLEPSNASPLYVASSFILPAPDIDVAKDTPPISDLRGYFCKLRLRRSVALKDGTKLSSDFTEPYWVQFLPEFSNYDSPVGSVPVTSLRVRLAPGTNIVAQLVNGAGKLELLKPFSIGTHALYLFLTRQVFDITGRQDAEVFIAVCRQDNANWIPDEQPLTTPLSQGSPIRARVVEVQFPPGATPPSATATEFWKALFPEPVDPTNLADSPMRIVRISAPINSSIAMQACAGGTTQ